MSDVHRCMIIPVSTMLTITGLADKFGTAAQGMWETELSPTGNSPATHLISAGPIGLEFAGIMPLKRVTTVSGLDAEGLPTSTLVVENNLADPTAMIDLAALLGVQGVPSASDYAALMAKVDVSNQAPFDAMHRLGLKLVSKPLI